MRILVVEDDQLLNKTLSYNLSLSDIPWMGLYQRLLP